MDEETITIFSGFPRSGTSMMMEMLEKGGIEPLTDKSIGIGLRWKSKKRSGKEFFGL